VNAIRRFLAVPDHAERLVAGVLFAISIGIGSLSIALGISHDGQPGPGLFPGIVSVILLVLSVLWFIQGARMPDSGAFSRAENFALEGAEAPLEEPSELEPTPRSGRILAFAVLAALVPMILMPIIGFTISMTIYVSGMLLVVGRTHRGWTVPIVLVGTIAVAIGAHAAGIYLPEPINYFRYLGL
jgi:hypothetical protein